MIIPMAWSRRLRRLELNTPLIIGAALTLAFVASAILAPVLAPHDPLEAFSFTNNGRLLPPPYPPGSADLPLGSDGSGRDMASRLIYGARYTLVFALLTTLVRLAVGCTFGLLAGWYATFGRLVDVVAAAVAAIPPLLFALVVLAIWPTKGALLQTLGLAPLFGLVGWTEATVRCRVAVQEMRRQPFIEAARALGRGRLAILVRHVVPNLRGLLLAEAAYAVAASLLLVGEIGILRLFVGGVDVSILGSLVQIDPRFPDWSGMIASGVRLVETAPWILAEPMLAFTLAILGFYLLAEGLRRRR